MEIYIHICNFLLPDSLLPANMQTTPPAHLRGVLSGPHPRDPCSSLQPLQAAPPLPPMGGGRIRGGLEEENVSKREEDKKRRATPLIQKSPSPVQLPF